MLEAEERDPLPDHMASRIGCLFEVPAQVKGAPR